jgi:hypothetical protein
MDLDRYRDYRQADCKLFRRPVIDTSAVDRLITQTLVDFWQKGTSADSAMNAVMGNEDVVNALASQVAENLEFQRHHGLVAIDTQRREAQQELEAEHDRQKADADRELGTAVKQAEEVLVAARNDEYSKKREYSIAHARLDQMRDRVHQRLESIGGREGLEQLLKINNDVQMPDEEPIGPALPSKKYAYVKPYGISLNSAYNPQPLVAHRIRSLADIALEEEVESFYAAKGIKVGVRPKPLVLEHKKPRLKTMAEKALDEEVEEFEKIHSPRNSTSYNPLKQAYRSIRSVFRR